MNELEIIQTNEEIEILEKTLRELMLTKNRHLFLIDSFNAQYSKELGEIIRKVLSLKRGGPYRKVADKLKQFEYIKETYDAKKEQYLSLKRDKERLESDLEKLNIFDDHYDDEYDKFNIAKSQLDNAEKELNEIRNKIKSLKEMIKDDPYHIQYQESVEDYQAFQEEQKELSHIEIIQLNEEQKNELKQLFRKAVKLCHPDKFPVHMKEQAQEIIQELNSAYKLQNLSRVQEIFKTLETSQLLNGQFDPAQHKDIVRFKITALKNAIVELQKDIQDIEQDETYVTIESLDDWDAHFKELKMLLTQEYEELKKELFQGI